MSNQRIILVLASKEDVHADAVVSHLYDLQQEVVRIDPGEFWPDSSTLSWHIDNKRNQAVLNWRGRIIEAACVGAVFNRDFSLPKAEDNQDIATLLKFAEARAALYGFFRTLENVYWMNPPWYDEMADNKPYQYACAMQAGLTVPRTLITNDPDKFLDFYEACNKEVIIKQLSEVCLIEEVEYPSKHSFDIEQTAFGFYTHKVNADHLEDISEVVNSPCLFQEHIVKKGDVRVTVVGDEVFATFIDSQSSKNSIVDFRHEPLLPLEDYIIPDDTKEKLLRILRKWGVQFAACDFALTPEGVLFFLEANVVGNWLWLERDTTSPIGESISLALARSF